RIRKTDGTVSDICVQVEIAARKPNRIFAQEPTDGGIVVSGAIEVQPGTIMCRAQNSADVCPGSNVHFAIPKVSHDLCQKRQSRIFRDFTTRFTRIFSRSQRFPKRINELRLVQALQSRAYQGGKQHVDRFWSFGDSNLVRYAYSSAWRSEIVRLVWRLRFEGNRRLL